MSKRLILILTLAFVVGISFAAFAEVQNVKVSGDITIGGVYRNNFDLAKPNALGDTARNPDTTTLTYRDTEKDFFSITRVRVDADLTDNVAVCVRLLNERNWNGESIAGTAENNRNIGLATANTQEESEIELDLAYVTLKEFLYSPLTLSVGRQEMRFGNGWIVGDPDTNGYALKSALAEGDLSLRKSFDAFRATLDYNPLILDMIFAKIAENNTVVNDDITLTGINANYAIDKNTTVEGFFFSKIKGSNNAIVTNVDGAPANVNAALTKSKQDVVNTVGVRAVNKSVKNLTIDAQTAFQFGTYNPKFDPNAFYVAGAGAQNSADVALRRAWGLEVFAAYDLKDIAKIAKYNPMLSAGYIYLSGDNRNRQGTRTYTGWDPMFEDQTFGHILNAIMGYSNMNGYILTAQVKPISDIGMKLDYIQAWFNKRYPNKREAGTYDSYNVLSGVSGARQFTMGKTKHIGQEIDLTMTYDYTEDVQFSLLGGLFLPGKAFNKPTQVAVNAQGGGFEPQRAAATEVVGTMKVTF